ncbi:hypothetical protein AQUCO_00700439v1 [Aquilegia coerulea]|uniref:Uncharacterized protein n=1 Tax=Aquilegia coerulea TaxID=218851 RepID=A0A2G5EKH4_AQUCA|nr:hypothetical protein AQUCO_00700439v1 [Aquilegia coerulea]
MFCGNNTAYDNTVPLTTTSNLYKWTTNISAINFLSQYKNLRESIFKRAILSNSKLTSFLSTPTYLFSLVIFLASMAIRLPGIPHIKRSLRRSLSNSETLTVPKGHIAVYVGENEKRRFVVPISYLSHPLFQELLNQAEEEFGFNHPMGGLTIPCDEDTFIELTSQLIVL